VDVRRALIRRLGAAVGLALIVLPAQAAAEAPPPISIEYHGTIDFTTVPGGTGTRTLHVQWELAWDIHPPLVAPSWQLKMLRGSVTAVVPPPNQATSCTGMLSDNPTLPVVSSQYTPGFVPGKTNVVQVNGNAPNVFLSSSPQTPFGFCGNEHNEIAWGAPSPQPHPDPTQAQIEYTLGSGAVTQPFKEDWREPPGGAEAHFVLDSVLAVNGTAPSIPATPKAVRDATLAALRAEMSQALYPCLTATAGLILFGTATPIGVLAGGTMFAVGAPQCAQAVALLVNLQKAYNDPPVAGYRTVAHVIRRPPARVALPSCSAHGAAVAAICRRLHSLALAWVSSLQRARESSQALATTVGREGAARAAHNAAAAALQAKTALRLLPTLHGDLRAQAAAGSALASFLRREHVSGNLSTAQSSAAIEDVVQKLARLGVTRTELEAEIAPQLKPTPLNLVSALAQPLR
jgi:hypothetical protein